MVLEIIQFLKCQFDYLFHTRVKGFLQSRKHINHTSTESRSVYSSIQDDKHVRNNSVQTHLCMSVCSVHTMAIHDSQQQRLRHSYCTPLRCTLIHSFSSWSKPAKDNSKHNLFPRSPLTRILVMLFLHLRSNEQWQMMKLGPEFSIICRERCTKTNSACVVQIMYKTVT